MKETGFKSSAGFNQSAPVAENRLLLLSCLDCVDRGYLGEGITESASKVRDWGYVLKQLIHHGTLLTFFGHIERLGLQSRVPEQFLKEVRQMGSVLKYRNIRYSDEISRLAGIFAENSVNYVFVKGPLLLLNGYYSKENRFMNDIDVLLLDNCIPKVSGILRSTGYSRPDDSEAGVKFKGETQFIKNSDKEIIVEVSTRLNKNYELDNCYPFRNKDLEGRMFESRAGKLAFMNIENEFHFAYCLYHHAALNYLYRLNWLNDLYLIYTKGAMDPVKLRGYLDKYNLNSSFGLFAGIFARYFRPLEGAGPVKLPAVVERVFLNGAAAFADLKYIESKEAVIRFSLISGILNKLDFILRKIFLPPEWLRFYYKLDKNTGVFRTYFFHLYSCLKRVLR
ncbi:MAG: nucleotidyltransferase family protein [Elusimicrobiota bacterium]